MIDDYESLSHTHGTVNISFCLCQNVAEKRCMAIYSVTWENFQEACDAERGPD